jgi:ABC-type dipeptide/oligopeptide/nickel transport system permease component
MKRLVRRFLITIPILFAIITLTFAITRLGGGDPAVSLAPTGASKTEIQQIRERIGTDKPVLDQYFSYIGDAVQLKFGTSFFTGDPVVDELRIRIPSTLELITLGLILAIVLGVGLGTVAAWKRGKPTDRAVRGGSFLVLAVPEFWLGLILLFLFYYQLGWFPPGEGQLGPLDPPPNSLTNAALLDAILTGSWSSVWPSITHLILPVITIGVGFAAPVARLTRAATLEVLGSDYVRFAQSVGLSRWTVRRYAMRASMAPVVAFIGILFSSLLGGAVLVEQVFSWGGVAQYAAQAAEQSDYPVVQGFVLFAGIFSVIVFLIVDLIVQWLDPRVRDA